MNHAKGKGKCRKCVSLDLSLPVLVVHTCIHVPSA